MSATPQYRGFGSGTKASTENELEKESTVPKTNPDTQFNSYVSASKPAASISIDNRDTKKAPVRVRRLSVAELEILSTNSLPESRDEWPKALRMNELSQEALHEDIKKRNLVRAIAHDEFLKKREEERKLQQTEQGTLQIDNHEHPWTKLNKTNKEQQLHDVAEAIHRAVKIEKEQGSETLAQMTTVDPVLSKAVKLITKERQKSKKSKLKAKSIVNNSNTPIEEALAAVMSEGSANMQSPETSKPLSAVPKTSGWSAPIVVTEREIFGVDLGKHANAKGAIPTTPEDAKLLEKARAKKAKKLLQQQKKLAKERLSPSNSSVSDNQENFTSDALEVTTEDLIHERRLQESELKLSQFVKILNQDLSTSTLDPEDIETTSAFDAMTSVASDGSQLSVTNDAHENRQETNEQSHDDSNLESVDGVSKQVVQIQQIGRMKSTSQLDKIRQQERLAALAVLRRKFLETMVTVLNPKQYDKFVQLFRRFRARARRIMEGTDAASIAAVDEQILELQKHQALLNKQLDAKAKASEAVDEIPVEHLTSAKPTEIAESEEIERQSRTLQNRAVAATNAAAKVIEEAMRGINIDSISKEQSETRTPCVSNVDSNGTEMDSLDQDLSSAVSVAEQVRRSTPKAAAAVFEAASVLGLSVSLEDDPIESKQNQNSDGDSSSAHSIETRPTMKVMAQNTNEVISHESVRKAVAEAVEALQQAEQSHSRRRKQLLDAAINSFYRQAVRIFEDEADVLTPMLARHLRQLTVKELETARERFGNAQMMSYVAAFVRPRTTQSGRRPIPQSLSESGPVAAALANTSELEVETNPNSPYLWSRLDTLSKTTFKVYVEGIPPAATTRELIQAFSACGRIAAVEIFRGEISDYLGSNSSQENAISGSAHVKLLSASAAQNAHNVDNPESADSTESGDGFYSPYSLPTDLPAPVPKTPVKIASKPPRSYVHGFIYFQTASGQAMALHPSIQLFGVCLQDAMVRTQPAPEKKVLFVGGFRKRMTHADILSTIRRTLKPFIPISSIASVNVPQASPSKNMGFAIVAFDSHESACIAQRQLSGSLLLWPTPNNLDAFDTVLARTQQPESETPSSISMSPLIPRELIARWTSPRGPTNRSFDFRSHPLMSYYPYVRAAAASESPFSQSYEQESEQQKDSQSFDNPQK